MGFFERLEKLQQAPASKRKIILIISVAFIMSLVIGIWILQLQQEFSEKSGTDAKSFAEPFKFVWQSFRESLKDGTNIIRENTKKLYESE